jgi:hypothetical protein
MAWQYPTFYLALIRLTDGLQMGEVRTYDLLRKSVRPRFRQARFNVSRQAEKRAAGGTQGEPPAPKIPAIRRCAMLVSRPDSEIDEASNGKAPLLTKRGLSETVVAEMNRYRHGHGSRHPACNSGNRSRITHSKRR